MPVGEPLSPIEFDFLWESCGAGEVPYPLELHSHGETVDERASLRRQTMAALAERGVVDAQGKPGRRLVDQFGVLAAAEFSVDSVHVNETDTKAVLAVAAAMDGIGLLAVQDGDGLWLNDVPSDGLVSSIVGLLPAAPRGKERSITVPVDQLMAGPGADFMQRKDGTGSDEERKALARLHAQPRLRGGQIAANVRSVLGGRSRSPVLSWFDTESGRYFTRASTGTDGRMWITIAPADAAALRQRVTEMLTWARREVA
ncbi:MAG: ESX secretion-associated protein EspG [Actinophytocola sp.]|nr:ESX secretion-associated protein EspG [Actinophytocola sp.]